MKSWPSWRRCKWKRRACILRWSGCRLKEPGGGPFPAASPAAHATQGQRRGGESGVDGELQRLRQRRHLRDERDRRAESDDDGDGGERRRQLRDHGGAGHAGGGELHVRVRERHADGDAGGADGDGEQSDEGVRRGESGVDGQLQRVRQRRHGGEPDDPATASTTATAASAPGTYPITASGAASANYTFSYVSGTLTVTPATLTVTATNQTKAYGAANPVLTVSYSGFVNGDTAATGDPGDASTTTATTASAPGTYPITASGAVSANYTFSYVSGTLTVAPAALTVTANNQTKAYGAANPALTVSYSGFVNGDTAASLTTPRRPRRRRPPRARRGRIRSRRAARPARTTRSPT